MAVKGECSACDWEDSTGGTIDRSKTPTEWARSGVASRFAVIRHLGHASGATPRATRPATATATALVNSDGPGDSKGLGYSFDYNSNKGVLKIEKRADRIIPLSEWLADLAEDLLDNSIPQSVGDFNYSVGHSVWGQNSTDEGLVTLYANKFSANLKPGKQKESPAEELNIDPTALLALLRSAGVGGGGSGGASGGLGVGGQWEESAFCLSINDIQLGQSYNGGSEATIEQFYRYIELAVRRIAELRKIGRTLGTLVVVGGGDLVEGCVIYPNQAFSLDLNRKEQVEGIVALLLHAFDVLAPLFDRVIVLAAAGNHGQNRINGNYTTLDDNDDTHCFEMAKLALSRDPSMAHIEWTIAVSEAGVACKVYDWVLATTHGDVYAKGVAGATIDKKAHAWMKNMALGREKFGLLGQANVLIGHHFHHEKGSDWGSCLWKQTPSQDRGSPYFENATGEYSEPGMLTWVMTPGERWKDEQVLRW